MTAVIIHHDHTQLPLAAENVIPVQVYGLDGRSRSDITFIGNPVLDKLKRLGVQISPAAMDFLTIALSVTAADTFVKRKNAADGWTREISLKVPLSDPIPWVQNKERLEKSLRFLSGDIWRLDLTEGGYNPPVPYTRKHGRQLISLHGLDCVSLFSGGLDSAVGVIDLLKDNFKPLLISHSYKGDKKRQEAIKAQLMGQFSHFSVNANPRSRGQGTDISMRTRSINFLAFAAVGGDAVRNLNNLQTIDLLVPENGFISLNAPLTNRRIGSLSTRTTHPHFLGLIQDIFSFVGIPLKIKNPYQFRTKGDMITSCKDRILLHQVLDQTVSCSHWKRKNQQCGRCVPCIIRRASVYKGGFTETQTYQVENLLSILNLPDSRDDLNALLIAIEQADKRPIGSWILDSGPLPPQDFELYKQVFTRGLEEVKLYLRKEGVL